MQKRSGVALIAGMMLVLALQGSAAQMLASNYISSFVWRSTDPRHGGFSGLELSDDGLSFIAISDRGGWTKGKITRDRAGYITDMNALPVRALLGRSGKPLQGELADSEGLAIAPNGQIYVSFEGEHRARILEYAQLDQPALAAYTEQSFSRLPQNSALEALAVDDAGTIHTLPEDASGDGTFRIYTYRNGQWQQPITLPADAGFSAVGADFGPDGRFYLLERGFHGMLGFSSRVRSFQLTATAARDMRVEMQTGAGVYDNLEALSVWRDGKGDIRLTMISDDNFFWPQRTEIVEYRVLP